jgi:hypothetical protein
MWLPLFQADLFSFFFCFHQMRGDAPKKSLPGRPSTSVRITIGDGITLAASYTF